MSMHGEFTGGDRALNDGRAGQKLLMLMRSDDRELLSIWSNGLMSCRAIARVLGCHSGTVSRRIRLLRARMADPVLHAVVTFERELPLKHRELAIRVLCQGEKINRVATDLTLGRREAERLLAEVKGWVRGRLQGVGS